MSSKNQEPKKAKAAQGATVNPVENLSAEQLRKRVQELEQKLEAQPKNLEEKIKLYQEKQRLIKQLGIVDAQAENLAAHAESLRVEAQKDEFKTDSYAIAFKGGNYRNETIFEIDNPVIIGDTIAYIMGRLQAKREQLLQKIEA